MSITLATALLDQVRIDPASKARLQSLEGHLMQRIMLNNVTKKRCVKIVVNFCYVNPLDDQFYDPHQGAPYIARVWYDAMSESRDEQPKAPENIMTPSSYIPKKDKQQKLEDYFTKYTIRN